METPRSFNPDHTTNWRTDTNGLIGKFHFQLLWLISQRSAVGRRLGLGPLNLFIRDLKYERNQHANSQANSGIKTTIILNNIELE